MQNSWRPYTTEKLFMAEQQLKACEGYAHEGSANNRHLEASSRQAAVLLMSLAWEGVLNELVECYQQQSGAISRLDELETLLGSDSPEVALLKTTASTQNSWLYDLYLLNTMLRQRGKPKTEQSESSSTPGLIIAVSEIAPDVDSLDNIRRVISEFKIYIKDFRSRMSEW